jgi:8-oxo-dGTP pyrophosphatase MutT (NUDIX family)
MRQTDCTVSEPENPWSVLGSRTLHEDHWLRLRVDRCRTAWGAEVPSYHVIELPCWANICALNEAHELILIREYRHGVGRTLLGLPGGRVEADESPLAGAQRELAEETGYGGGRWFATQRMFSSPAMQNNHGDCFLVVGARPDATRNLDPAERIEVVPTPFDEVVAQIARREIQMAAYDVASILAAAGVVMSLPEQKLRPLRRRLAAAWRAAYGL